MEETDDFDFQLEFLKPVPGKRRKQSTQGSLRLCCCATGADLPSRRPSMSVMLPPGPQQPFQDKSRLEQSRKLSNVHQAFGLYQ